MAEGTESDAVADPKPASSVRGLTLILVATVSTGIIAYVITWLVPRQIGFGPYAAFAVFWSFLYLVVGALSGIQQEVTRATRRTEAGAGAGVNRARNFGLAASAVVFGLVIASSPLWVGSVFSDIGWSLVWPLALGASSYVFVAVLSASLYGITRWVPIAVMMFADGCLRLASVAVVLLVTHDVVALAWAVALPFPIVFILMWPFVRRSLVGKTQLDVGYRRLTANVAQTIVAAASTGVMVSGFPLLLGLTSPAESKATVGLFILSITLTRAPLIVVAMSLQSYLIVFFRERQETLARQLAKIIGAMVAVGLVLSVAGWYFGPAVFALLFPGERVPGGWFIMALVLSSAMVGALCVTAPAVLSRSYHIVYSAGWLAGAVATILFLLLPTDLSLRTILALVVAPVVGLVVHIGYLALATRKAKAGRSTAT